ncbi:MAG: hypothetical protein ACE5L6_06940, partial [Candidatus Bathyarchaeia archaeon]
MIDVHCKEMDGMWFGVAVEGKSIGATSFSPTEEEVLRSLLEKLPFDTPFKVADEPCHFSSEALGVMKAIFNGRDISAKFRLCS